MPISVSRSKRNHPRIGQISQLFRKATAFSVSYASLMEGEESESGQLGMDLLVNLYCRPIPMRAPWNVTVILLAQTLTTRHNLFAGGDAPSRSRTLLFSKCTLLIEMFHNTRITMPIVTLLIIRALGPARYK